MSPADGMGIDWYEGEVVKAQQALQAEYRRLLADANLRADVRGRELNERNQLLQDVEIVLSKTPDVPEIAELRKRIAKLSKKGGRRRGR